MKFCWSTLNVRNMEESIKFYTDILGLEVANRFKAGPVVEIAFLGNGETKIELICTGSNQETNIGSDISWGFEVDNLDEVIESIKEKGIQAEGPFQPNPQVRFFYVKDPNGMKIQLVQH